MDEVPRVTTRRGSPKEVVRQGNRTYIHAFCYMRNEDRYFNTRRYQCVLRAGSVSGAVELLEACSSEIPGP